MPAILFPSLYETLGRSKICNYRITHTERVLKGDAFEAQHEECGLED